MQSSGTLWEVALGEFVYGAFEVSEYFTYLSGKTQLSRSIGRVQVVWGWLRGLTRQVTVSSDGAANEAAQAVRAERVQTMTNVAVMLGIVDGISLIMTTGAYLMLPLNPTVIGEEAVIAGPRVAGDVMAV